MYKDNLLKSKKEVFPKFSRIKNIFFLNKVKQRKKKKRNTSMHAGKKKKIETENKI